MQEELQKVSDENKLLKSKEQQAMATLAQKREALEAEKEQEIWKVRTEADTKLRDIQAKTFTELTKTKTELLSDDRDRLVALVKIMAEKEGMEDALPDDVQKMMKPTKRQQQNDETSKMVKDLQKAFKQKLDEDAKMRKWAMEELKKLA